MFLIISHPNIRGSRIKRRQIFYRIVSTMFCKQSCHHIPSFPLMYRTISSYWDTRRTFQVPSLAKHQLCRSLHLQASTILRLPRSLQLILRAPELPSTLSAVPLRYPHDEFIRKQKKQQQTHNDWRATRARGMGNSGFHAKSCLAKANRWSLLSISRNKLLGIWVILSVSLKMASRQKQF